MPPETEEKPEEPKTEEKPATEEKPEPPIETTPREKMARAFTQFSQENPLFPARMQGNTTDHYSISAFGVGHTMNTDSKGKPRQCLPETEEEARALIDEGVAALRKQLEDLVKSMIKALGLNITAEE